MQSASAQQSIRTIPMCTGSRYVRFGNLHLEVPGFKNPRNITGLTEESIDEMADSLKAGLETPLLVQRVIVGGLLHELVFNGQRRYRGLERLKISKEAMIPVVDIDPMDSAIPIEECAGDLILRALKVGRHVEGLSTYEQLAAVAPLVGEKKQSEIARSLRRSEGWTSKMLKAWKTSFDPLRLALREGKITDEQFKDLAAVEIEGDQQDALNDILGIRARGQKGAANAVAREHAERAQVQKKARELTARTEPKPGLADEMRAGTAAKYTKHAPGVNFDLLNDAETLNAAATIDRLVLDKDKKALGKLTTDDFTRLRPSAIATPSPAHQRAAKGVVTKATAAAAPPRGPKHEPPNKLRIAEFSKLRDERRGAKHAYVRGMVDFAAYVLGEISEKELGAPWKGYLKQLRKLSARKPSKGRK